MRLESKLLMIDSMRSLVVPGSLLLVLTVTPSCSDTSDSAKASTELVPVIDVNPAVNIVEVNLVAGPGSTQYLSAGLADIWGYREGSKTASQAAIPGPLITANKGDRVVVHFRNDLPESTTLHWHGIRVPNMADGTPSTQKEVAPGESFDYEFTADDAGTFWYHPHVRGEIQLERGLYGMLVVKENDGISVTNDRAFVLDDVKLESTGKLSTRTDALDLMLGRQGNVLLVNGKVGPQIEVKSGARERWRFVNAANGRYFNLRLPGHKFTVISWDGGLLPQPYEADTVLIAPGERYEVLVTVTRAVGALVDLVTIHYDRGHEIPDPGVLPLLTLKVGAAAPPPAALPATWGRSVDLEVPADAPTRTLVLQEEEPKEPGQEPKFFINNQRFPDVPSIDGKEGAVEIWSVKSDTEMDHPFHLHGMFFRVLDVDGVPPLHVGWKDTVNVPQKKTLRFAVRYGAPGVWMYHCHILEHAERGMMGELRLSP